MSRERESALGWARGTGERGSEEDVFLFSRTLLADVVVAVVAVAAVAVVAAAAAAAPRNTPNRAATPSASPSARGLASGSGGSSVEYVPVGVAASSSWPRRVKCASRTEESAFEAAASAADEARRSAKATAEEESPL